jgi:hypothetical protein
VSALRNFVGAFKVKVGDIEFGMEPAPGRADTGNLEQDLPDLIKAVAEAAKERDSAIGLFIDEVQYTVPMFDVFMKRQIPVFERHKPKRRKLKRR